MDARNGGDSVSIEPVSRRKSSILKQSKSPSQQVLQEVDNNTEFVIEDVPRKEKRVSRRVSFAETHQIKEYVLAHSGGNTQELAISRTISGTDMSITGDSWCTISAFDQLLLGEIHDQCHPSMKVNSENNVDNIVPKADAAEKRSREPLRTIAITHNNDVQVHCGNTADQPEHSLGSVSVCDMEMTVIKDHSSHPHDKTVLWQNCDEDGDMTLTSCLGASAIEFPGGTEFDCHTCLGSESMVLSETRATKSLDQQKTIIFNCGDEMEFTAIDADKSMVLSQTRATKSLDQHKTIIFNCGGDMEFTTIDADKSIVNDKSKIVTSDDYGKSDNTEMATIFKNSDDGSEDDILCRLIGMESQNRILGKGFSKESEGVSKDTNLTLMSKFSAIKKLFIGVSTDRDAIGQCVDVVERNEEEVENENKNHPFVIDVGNFPVMEDISVLPVTNPVATSFESRSESNNVNNPEPNFCRNDEPNENNSDGVVELFEKCRFGCDVRNPSPMDIVNLVPEQSSGIRNDDRVENKAPEPFVDSMEGKNMVTKVGSESDNDGHPLVSSPICNDNEIHDDPVIGGEIFKSKMPNEYRLKQTSLSAVQKKQKHPVNAQLRIHMMTNLLRNKEFSDGAIPSKTCEVSSGSAISESSGDFRCPSETVNKVSTVDKRIHSEALLCGDKTYCKSSPSVLNMREVHQVQEEIHTECDYLKPNELKVDERPDDLPVQLLSSLTLAVDVDEPLISKITKPVPKREIDLDEEENSSKKKKHMSPPTDDSVNLNSSTSLDAPVSSSTRALLESDCQRVCELNDDVFSQSTGILEMEAGSLLEASISNRSVEVCRGESSNDELKLTVSPCNLSQVSFLNEDSELGESKLPKHILFPDVEVMDQFTSGNFKLQLTETKILSPMPTRNPEPAEPSMEECEIAFEEMLASGNKLMDNFEDVAAEFDELMKRIPSDEELDEIEEIQRVYMEKNGMLQELKKQLKDITETTLELKSRKKILAEKVKLAKENQEKLQKLNEDREREAKEMSEAVNRTFNAYLEWNLESMEEDEIELSFLWKSVFLKITFAGNTEPDDLHHPFRNRAITNVHMKVCCQEGEEDVDRTLVRSCFKSAVNDSTIFSCRSTEELVSVLGELSVAAAEARFLSRLIWEVSLFHNVTFTDHKLHVEFFNLDAEILVTFCIPRGLKLDESWDVSVEVVTGNAETSIILDLLRKQKSGASFLTSAVSALDKYFRHGVVN